MELNQHKTDTGWTDASQFLLEADRDRDNVKSPKVQTRLICCVPQDLCQAHVVTCLYLERDFCGGVPAPIIAIVSNTVKLKVGFKISDFLLLV